MIVISEFSNLCEWRCETQLKVQGQFIDGTGSDPFGHLGKKPREAFRCPNVHVSSEALSITNWSGVATTGQIPTPFSYLFLYFTTGEQQNESGLFIDCTLAPCPRL